MAFSVNYGEKRRRACICGFFFGGGEEECFDDHPFDYMEADSGRSYKRHIDLVCTSVSEYSFVRKIRDRSDLKPGV